VATLSESMAFEKLDLPDRTQLVEPSRTVDG
jgi:hypothetical protein